jgi:hypothetical protein
MDAVRLLLLVTNKNMRNWQFRARALLVALGLSFVSSFEFQTVSAPSQKSLPSSPESTESHRSDLWCRRKVVLLPSLVLIPTPGHALAAAAPREIDVGGGFDLLGELRMAEKDVVYPISMEGPWIINRVVTQLEGDTFQAGSAWTALGGGDDLKPQKVERYRTRFVKSDIILGTMSGVVTDRGFELEQRAQKSNVSWSVEEPNVLAYDKFRISVVMRSVEPPTDQGFGFNELYRIDDGLVLRAVQVKRRYRRAFDSAGNRVVEGLEIMKTFRVLDGVAGTEMPTSTTKSQLTLTKS